MRTYQYVERVTQGIVRVTTAHQQDCYRTEEAACGGALLQIADPCSGLIGRDHLFGGMLEAEELVR